MSLVTERLNWLDGVRAAAASFVVLHHVWHLTWHDYPHNSGPWVLGWMLYGHLAVAVFIVVSGFSLALAPLRHEQRLRGGARRFIRRRAWRIIPAYWAALALSTVLFAVIISPETSGSTLVRSVVVHGLLIQDIIPSVDPNGAFWSIAVEWQIYFLFPVILWVARRWSLMAAVTLTVSVVVGAHVLADTVSAFDGIHHLSPQFLALFAMGVLAAKAVTVSPTRIQRRRLAATCIAILIAFVVAANTAGSAWIVDQYFWIDLVFGIATASFLAVVTAGGFPTARRLLGSRPAVFIGGFSYSLYLMHGPLLHSLNKLIVEPLALPKLAQFVGLVGVGVPLIFGLCYAFYLGFEKPFIAQRGSSAIREMPIVQAFHRLRRPSAPTPARARA